MIAVVVCRVGVVGGLACCCCCSVVVVVVCERSSGVMRESESESKRDS